MKNVGCIHLKTGFVLVNSNQSMIGYKIKQMSLNVSRELMVCKNKTKNGEEIYSAATS